MMMTKEQAVCKTLELAEPVQLLKQMVSLLETSLAEGKRIDEVERELVSRLFDLGLRLLMDFVAQAGPGMRASPWR